MFEASGVRTQFDGIGATRGGDARRARASQDGAARRARRSSTRPIDPSSLEMVARALERGARDECAPSLGRREIETIYALAFALFNEGRAAQSADLFQLLVLCAPQQARGWLGLGACRERLRQPELALIAYEGGLIAPDGDGAREQLLERVRALRPREHEAAR